MILILIAALLIYYLILVMIYPDIFLRKKKEPSQESIPDLPAESEIMGKTTFQVGTIRKDVEQSAPLPEKEELQPVSENIFASETATGEDENEEIEIEMGYEVDPVDDIDEDEEILQYMDYIPAQAQGITFEEIGQITSVLKDGSDTEEKEREALHRLTGIENTPLFDDILDSIDKGRQRVADLLNKYDLIGSESALLPETEAGHDLSTFSLNDYI